MWGNLLGKRSCPHLEQQQAMARAHLQKERAKKKAHLVRLEALGAGLGGE